MTTVLITGASSGIGLAAAEATARRGVDVVATVRTGADAEMVEARLGALGLAVRPALLDVTDPDGIAAVVRDHRPDVVVSNAGDALLGPVLEQDLDDVRRQLEVHVVAPLALARAALEQARADERALRVVNVSSFLHRRPMPMTGWYAAAKAAQSSLTLSLRTEAPEGLEVVEVELGAVDTPAWEAAAEEMADGGRDERRWGRLTAALRPAFAGVGAAAEAIASAATDERPRAHYCAGFGKLALSAAPLVPPAVLDPLLRLVAPPDPAPSAPPR